MANRKSQRIIVKLFNFQEKTMKNRYILLVIINILFLFACNNPSVKLDKLAVKDLQGQEVELSKFEGKPIFVNFWATWCGPCRKEKPSLHKAQQILAKEGWEFLAISQEEQALLQQYKATHPYQFTYLQAQKNIKLSGVFEIPQSYVINKKGEVVYSFTGAKDWSTPENIAMLQKLVD